MSKAKLKFGVSVSKPFAERWRREADSRGVGLGPLMNACLARALDAAEEEVRRAPSRSRNRQPSARRRFLLDRKMKMRIHGSRSAPPPPGIAELLLDHIARHGGTMSALLEAALDAALDIAEGPMPQNPSCALCLAPLGPEAADRRVHILDNGSRTAICPGCNEQHPRESNLHFDGGGKDSDARGVLGETNLGVGNFHATKRGGAS